MKNILIIGGGGMVGQKLAAQLAAGALPDVGTVTLFDQAFPATSAPGEQVMGNLTDQRAIEALAARRFDLVYHLAAIVSGEAETDFDKGWAVNMSAVWTLLEALRAQHLQSDGAYVPRVVFTSSIAAFGAPFPAQIGDEFFCAPQTSYGAQKVIGELMVGDFARKGFIDGLSLRLPTICVRPGAANKAASSFFSGIIREPLNGQEAILPVGEDVRHWHASPRSAAGFLVHAAGLDTALLNGRRTLNLPGVSCTVGEQIEALRALAGADVVKLIRPQADPMIEKIVGGWPRDFDPKRAVALGFKADHSFEDIIRVYLEDDFPGRAPAP